MISRSNNWSQHPYVVIGQTDLCLVCCQHLVAKGSELLLVVTEDLKIINWCLANDISYTTFDAYRDLKLSSYILLSIVNYHIINNDLLNHHQVVLAINYHDSLLPRYAGLNSTSWALLNKEQCHGVSWHVISERIDSGDVLRQALVDIDPDDTAQSLNLKCTEAAITEFYLLIDDMNLQSLSFHSQSQADRTYYGLTDLPENYGFVNGLSLLSEVESTCRALTLGNTFSNTLATPKLWLNGAVFVLEEASQNNYANLSPTTWLNAYGESVTLSQSVSFEDMPTYQLSDQQCAFLSSCRQSELKWKRRLSLLSADTNAMIDSRAVGDVSEVSRRAIGDLTESDTVTCIVLALARVFQTPSLVTLYQSIPSEMHLDHLVDEKVLIDLSVVCSTRFVQDIDAMIAGMRGHPMRMVKDFHYRYQCMHLLTDVAICSHVPVNSLPQKTRLIVSYSDTHVAVSCDQDDRVLANAILASIVELSQGYLEAKQTNRCFTDMPIMPIEDYHDLVHGRFQGNRYSTNACSMVDCFEAQATAMPSRMALVSDTDSLTYQALDERSNQLARQLIQEYEARFGMPLPAETLIVLCQERGIDWVVSVLAILKVGAAYVPVDVSSPDDRIAYIVDDSAAAMALISPQVAARLTPLMALPVLVVDHHAYESLSCAPLSVAIDAQQLAYVLYTSGTTGRPKGVLQLHGNVIRLFFATERQMKFNQDDVWTLFHSGAFDFSVWEMWGALLHGGRLVIPSADVVKDTQLFYQLCCKENVTVLNQTPGAFQQFALMAADANRPDGLRQLRYVIFGGEALLSQHLETWWHYAAQSSLSTQLVNMYGITETTVHVTCALLQPDEPITIGKPLEDLTTYVLSKDRQLLPVGVIGELYVGGAGLARGYLHQPALTSERFIANPFQTENDRTQGRHDRLYKTGDLVRLMPNGDLVYCGRNDHQVKIRGYRIELGEIERVLLTHDAIAQAVVLARDKHSGGQQLVAYYVASGSVLETELESHLVSQLPDYMIPSCCIRVEYFPLTVNGKVDMDALHQLGSEQDVPRFQRAMTLMEQELHALWTEVFGDIALVLDDDFFRLGGDSILAIQLAAQCRKAGFSCAVKDIFQCRTLERLAAHLSCRLHAQPTEPLSPVTVIESQLTAHALCSSDVNHDDLEAIYPATSLQQGFIYHHLYRPSDDAYHIQIIYHYYQPLDMDCYLDAWRFAIATCPPLRMAFSWHDELSQLIYKTGRLNYKYNDISEEGADQQERLIDNAVSHDRAQLFDLTQPSLFRLRIFKLSDNHCLILRSEHHAILDGWSGTLLLNKVHEYYQSMQQGKQPPLVADATYPQAQQYMMDHQSAALSYWKAMLSRFTSANDLAPLFGRQIDLNDQREVVRPASETLVMSNPHHQSLREFSKHHGITMSVLLQFCWHKLINVLTGDQQTTVGTTVSGRDLPVAGIEDSVGMYINTLPLMIDWDHKLPVLDQLHVIQRGLACINDNSFVHLSQLQNNGERLFHSLFVFENYPKVLGVSNDQGSLFAKDFRWIEKINYPLGVIAYESGGELHLQMKYDRDSLDPDAAKDLLERVLIISHQLVEHPNQSHHAVSVVTDAELKHLTELNQATFDVSERQGLPAWFVKQATAMPSRVALVSGTDSLTYQALDERSNQLARQLMQKHEACFGMALPAETLIVLCQERGIDWVVSVLAILKVGAAYVPVDVSSPDDRIAYIVDDSAAAMALISPQVAARLTPLMALPVLVVDHHAYESLSCAPLSVAIDAQQLAYVLYTSGTTGRPKGVLQLHGNVIRLFFATERQMKFNQDDVWTLFHSGAFDFSVWEMWGALLHGGRLVIPSADVVKDTQLFYQLCCKENVTVLNQTPGAFQQFALMAADANRPDGLRQLRYVIFGGEALLSQHLETWWHYAAQSSLSTQLVNMYGITETTVHVTCALLQPDEPITIGKPLEDLTTYVLSKDRQLLPVGVIGELYVGGAGLARGYLHQPALTSERFIANPFQTENDRTQGRHDRLYKTGDLVRLMPNGDLVYCGRNDHQVKIRGYRIELGEIERVLLTHDAIAQAVVLARDKHSGGQQLVAYYVASGSVLETELESHLVSQLPDYMMPAAFIAVDEFAVTMNGKLDRDALPDVPITTDQAVIAPRDQGETALRAIWSSLLGVPEDTLSTRDNFFRLGGDSIVSIQLVNQVRSTLGVTIRVQDIFTHKTMDELYSHVISPLLSSSQTLMTIKRESGILTGDVDLLPIQRWFFDCEVNDAHHWNQAFMIKVPPLSLTRLSTCVDQLVQHHDVLRLRYRQQGDDVVQYFCNDTSPVKIHTQLVAQLTPAEIDRVLTQWQAHFDLSAGPLISVGYLDGYDDGSARLHIAVHHLLVDAVSWRILTDDLRALYHEEPLGDKGSSYRQWVAAVNEYGNQHASERAYWDSVLSDHSASLCGLNSIQKTSDAHKTHVRFTRDVTETLLSGINHVYQTQINDVLLTALSESLTAFTGMGCHHVILEGHGREDIDLTLDITQTVGWFTSFYPVRLQTGEDALATLKHLKDGLRAIPNKGLGYGALQGYQVNDLPAISFNYLGQFKSRSSNESQWSIVNESVGDTRSIHYRDHYLLNINGLVIDDCLEFTLEGYLSLAELDQLAAIYLEKLTTLVMQLSREARQYLTVSDVDHVVDQETLDELQRDHELEWVGKANSLQQGFIYHALTKTDDDTAYHLQLLWQYSGQLMVDTFRQAWECAINHYPALRLRFYWKDALLQLVDREARLCWRTFDWSDSSSEACETQIQNLMIDDKNRGYHLEQGQLCRWYLIKQPDHQYMLMFSHHHAIIDGWSMSQLLDMVHRCYGDLLLNNAPSFSQADAYIQSQVYVQANANIQYGDWADRYDSVDSQRMDLSGLLKTTSSQVDLSQYRTIVDPQQVKRDLDRDLMLLLEDVSQQYNVTLSTLIHYAWQTALHVYSGSSVTISGVVVSGRALPITGIDHSVGLFINTLPVMVNHETDDLVATLQQIQTDINHANQNSQVNLADLSADVGGAFDCLFVFENYPSTKQATDDFGFQCQRVGSDESHNYPLSLLVYCDPLSGDMELQLHYAGELFSQARIDTLSLLVHSILTDLAHQRTLLSHGFYHDEVLALSRGVDVDQRSRPYLLQYIKDQVTRGPERIALRYHDQVVSYAQLDVKSNQLARYLTVDFGIQSGQRVGVSLTRSPQWLVAVVALLKAGAVYVPIDPTYPEARIQWIVSDAQCHAIITSDEYEALFWTNAFDAAVISLDDAAVVAEIDQQSAAPLELDISPDDVVYMIYTSGSTGDPKGVMVTQKNIGSYLDWLQSYLALSSDDRVDCSSSLSFDLTVTTSIAPLCFGAQVVLCDQEVKNDPAQYGQYLTANHITVAKLTPSYISVLLPHLLTGCYPQTLKRVIVGGEAARRSDLVAWVSYASDLQIYNEYGPTETTVGVSVYQFNKNNMNGHVNDVPIGRPALHASLYVMNDKMQLLPPGAIGQLYVGGDHVSAGYFNRPKLNDERFIQSCFHADGRLYQTGDLVRWTEEGDLQYLGRIDDQVKINGFRVEVGEVEQALLQHEFIDQCVVICKVRESGDQYLVAYYVAVNHVNEDINHWLDQRLPSHMLPSYCVPVAVIPLTDNGKVNKDALPAPQSQTSVDDQLLPKGEMEITIQEAMAFVLDMPRSQINANDDFFTLGGNSITCIRLVNYLTAEKAVSIQIADIFEYKTISSIASHVTFSEAQPEVYEIEF